MTENRTYTEADLKALRKEWEAEAVQRDIVKQVAEIKGQLLMLPTTIEATARAVAEKVIAEQHRTISERAWGRAPAVMQAIYLLMTLGAVAAAWVAGRGHI